MRAQYKYTYLFYAQAYFLIDDVVTRNSHCHWRHALALELQLETEKEEEENNNKYSATDRLNNLGWSDWERL